MKGFLVTTLFCLLIEFVLPGRAFTEIEIVRSRFIPLAIYADGLQTSRMEIQLNPNGEAPLSISVTNPYQSILIDGQWESVLTLYDDGTYGDIIAGDGIYTRNGIQVSGDTILRYRDHTVDRLSFYPLSILILNTAEEIKTIPFSAHNAPSLGLVSPDVGIQVYEPASDIRMSDRIVNMIIESPFEDSFHQSGAVLEEGTIQNQALRRFFQLFHDEYDFIFLLPESNVMGDYPIHTLITNDVSGIGLSAEIDYSQSVGSEGYLKGVMRLPMDPNGSFLQAIMRQWGVYLSSEFGFGGELYPNSWGLSSVNGALGGYNPESYVNNMNGTVNVDFFLPGGSTDTKPYADLELYLAGMKTTQEITPVTVIRDGQIESQGRTITIRLGTPETITIQQIINVHGPRIPAYQESQTDFRAAFIVLSTHPFEQSELAFYHAIAKHLSQKYTSSEYTFYLATKGEGTLDTILGEFKDPALWTVRRPQPTPTPVQGDYNADGRIHINDVIHLANEWGKDVSQNNRFDLNDDGAIDQHDLLLLIEGKKDLP